MIDILPLRHYLRRAFLSLTCLVVLAFFGYQAFVGDNGSIANLRLQKESRQLQLQLDQLVIQREKLEHRISLLDRASIDPDMLDERARAVLNYVHPKEIIILKSRTP